MEWRSDDPILELAAGLSTLGMGTANVSTLLLLTFATWNLRGLANPNPTPDPDKLMISDQVRYARTLKREQLVEDCVRYGIDICGLQETKCREPENIIILNNYRLIIFKQVNDWHGGIGFVISARMCDYIKSAERISDCVCYLDLTLVTTPSWRRFQEHPCCELLWLHQSSCC